MRRRWWAVWLAEYPDDGSMHVRATTEAAAKKKARRSSFRTEDWGEPMELVAARVTAAEHREWLAAE